MTSRFLRARSVALACTLLAAGAAGCRTAAPQRVVCEVVQPSPQVAQQSPAVTTFDVEPRPRVVVTPGAGTYVVVASGPVRIGSRIALSVAYLAAADRGAATAPDADERLRFAADALFRTQQVLAEAAGAELFSVTALFGAPGQPGVSQEPNITLRDVRAALGKDAMDRLRHFAGACREELRIFQRGARGR